MRVDNIVDQLGVIDSLPALSLDIPDNELIKNLNYRISDSTAYWDQPMGFNLKQARANNSKLLVGKELETTTLYRYQKMYVENQIFVANESIIAYLTQNPAVPEVIPAQDSITSRKLAIDLEKALKSHSQTVNLNRIVDTMARNLLSKRIGIIYWEFDPGYGDNGEVIPHVVDPEHVILDKNCPLGGNPAFICHVLKYSVEEICYRYPEKKKQIFEKLGIQRGTPKQMTKIVAVRRVWLTHYKNGEPIEACVTYFGDLVLGKYKDPNWNYAKGKNFLRTHKKPFTFLNYINDGQHLIDITTPIEQASPMQEILNKRTRQITENADKANGTLVISTSSGLTKDDLQNWTGDPNQKLLIKTGGQAVSQLIYQVPPHDLPAWVINDKLDARTQLLTIMGTPTEFTGTEDGTAGERTLGQAIMKKNQASGRQDLILRAIHNFLNEYYSALVQMMCVWYDKDHFFVYNGGDGEFDYVTLNRDMIEDGLAIGVKAGIGSNSDKTRQEAIALQLLKMDKISILDAYKDLHLDGAQKRYDNYAKEKADPMAMARDAMEDVSDGRAFVDFTKIMNGIDVKDFTDRSKEYVLTMRKLMLTDEFLDADAKKQNRLLKFIKKVLDNVERRYALDQATQNGGVEALDPSLPFPPLQPFNPQTGLGQAPGGIPPASGGAPMGGMPGGAPGMPPGALPVSALGAAPQQPSALGGLGAPENGTPLQNIASPQLQNTQNPANLPVL